MTETTNKNPKLITPEVIQKNKETPLQIDARKERGLQIFNSKRIVKDRKRHGLVVPSQNSNKKYFVTEDFVCDCPDYQKRGHICKHGYAAKHYLSIERHTPKGVETTKVRLYLPSSVEGLQ